MSTQPDQNQPAPPPMNYDPSQDRANPANWVDDPAAGDTRAPDEDEPKGQALDDALTEAGLPKTGTADEKRQRLAEHESQQ